MTGNYPWWNGKLLPEKLSDCIDLALADLEKVERDARYVVDMNGWHGPITRNHKQKCLVCFAGSIMATTLEVKPDVHASPSSFGLWNEVRLNALDTVRSGFVTSALVEVFPSLVIDDCGADMGDLISRVVPQYRLKPNEFKEALRAIATDLRAKGF